MAKEKKPEGIRTREDKTLVLTALSGPDRADYIKLCTELAEKIEKLNIELLRKGNEVAALKEQVKGDELELGKYQRGITDALAVLRKGSHMKMTPIVVEYNYNTATVSFLRKSDRKEVQKSRAMTADELQVPLTTKDGKTIGEVMDEETTAPPPEGPSPQTPGPEAEGETSRPGQSQETELPL
jgi:hypothetical protein